MNGALQKPARKSTIEDDDVVGLGTYVDSDEEGMKAGETQRGRTLSTYTASVEDGLHIYKSGFLSKLGRTTGMWQMRWFVLRSDCMLFSFYHKDEGTLVKGLEHRLPEGAHVIDLKQFL